MGQGPAPGAPSFLCGLLTTCIVADDLSQSCVDLFFQTHRRLVVTATQPSLCESTFVRALLWEHFSLAVLANNMPRTFPQPALACLLRQGDSVLLLGPPSFLCGLLTTCIVADDLSQSCVDLFFQTHRRLVVTATQPQALTHLGLGLFYASRIRLQLFLAKSASGLSTGRSDPWNEYPQVSVGILFGGVGLNPTAAKTGYWKSLVAAVPERSDWKSGAACTSKFCSFCFPCFLATSVLEACPSLCSFLTPCWSRDTNNLQS